MRGNSAFFLYMFRVRGKVERPKTAASNGFYTRNGNFQHPKLAKVVYAEFLFRFAKSLEDLHGTERGSFGTDMKQWNGAARRWSECWKAVLCWNDSCLVQRALARLRAQGHPLDLGSRSIVIGGMQRRISSLHVLVNGHVVLVPVR